MKVILLWGMVLSASSLSFYVLRTPLIWCTHLFSRHSRAGGNLELQAGVRSHWILACARMTIERLRRSMLIWIASCARALLSSSRNRGEYQAQPDERTLVSGTPHATKTWPTWHYAIARCGNRGRGCQRTLLTNTTYVALDPRY